MENEKVEVILHTPILLPDELMRHTQEFQLPAGSGRDKNGFWIIRFHLGLHY